MQVHGTGGCGGRSRSSPTGGRAYGMPRQASTPSAISAPRSFPWPVSATGTMEPDSARSPLARTIGAGHFLTWGGRGMATDRSPADRIAELFASAGCVRLPGGAGSP